MVSIFHCHMDARHALYTDKKSSIYMYDFKIGMADAQYTPHVIDFYSDWICLHSRNKLKLFPASKMKMNEKFVRSAVRYCIDVLSCSFQKFRNYRGSSVFLSSAKDGESRLCERA